MFGLAVVLINFAEHRAGLSTGLVGACSLNLKAAVVVVANLTGPGRMERIEHLLRIGCWHKGYQFCQHSGFGSQNLHVLQPQFLGNFKVNTPYNVV